MLKQKLESLAVDLLARLSSRTLWVTVVIAVVLAANNQWTELAVVVATYIGGEKGLDAVQSIRGKKAVLTAVSTDITASEDSVDRDKVVTGAHHMRTYDEVVDEE